jgi:hypothetical protein
LVHRRTTSAVKRNLTADVSDNMAYTVLRGHRHAIAIPNVQASTQDERMIRAVNFATAKMLTVKVHNFLKSKHS